MRTLTFCLATAVAAAPAGAQDLLFTTLQRERTLAPLRPSLHAVEPQDVMVVSPRVPIPPGYTAEKFQPHDALLTLVGDHDGDASYWEAILAAHIDAICVARGAAAGGTPKLRDLYFSTSQDVISLVSGTQALQGDVVRVRPGGHFETFLSEGRVQAAFAITTPRIDVDAFEYDPQGVAGQFPPPGPLGMVYLSLEDDHLMKVDCGGVAMSLEVEDGAILAAPVLGFDAKGAILGQGILVATEADVGALVFVSGIADHTGAVVGRLIDDLDGLDLDPLPGAAPLWASACGKFPHLKLCGERLTGGGIVSTHFGGSIAVINGLPMGSPAITDGSQDGLRPVNVGSLNGLETDYRICRFVTETRGPVVPGGGVANIDIGGAPPGSAVHLLLSTSVLPFPPAGVATSIPWANACFPELMVPIAGAPIFVGFAAADGTQELNLPWGGGAMACLVWQAVAVTPGGALHLSTPIHQELRP